MFYFKDFLPTKENKELTVVTESEKNLEYQINSDVRINSLMSEYYSALVVCDQSKLQSLVVDPSQFDNMDNVFFHKNSI